MRRLATTLLLAATLALPALSGTGAEAREKRTADQAQKHDVQAALLFNFGKFVVWPASSLDEGSPFCIAVWRRPELAQALEEIAAVRKISRRPVEVRTVDDASRLTGCQMVFLPRDSHPALPGLRDLAADRNLLTVGEHDGFIQDGGMILMSSQSGRIQLEINEAEAWRADLKISAELLDIALRVIPRPREAHP